MQNWTLTLADTNAHKLHDLIVAANAALGTPNPDLITDYDEMVLTGDTSNGAKNIYSGGADIDPTANPKLYSDKIGADQSVTFRKVRTGPRIYTKEIYVRADAATAYLHVKATP